MSHKKWLRATAVLLILGCVLYYVLVPQRGKVIERWQTGNGAFNIRVTAYSERPSLPGLGGAFYVFDSSALSSDRWREIMTFRHDTPVEIPREQIRVVNDQIGYVFMGWMYGVTTDAGGTWSVWNANEDLPGWQCCDYNLIQNVHISSDGTGRMTLNPPFEGKGQAPELRTKDYGRHWGAE